MNSAALARYAPLTGVVAVVLWILALITTESNSPGDNATGEEIISYFDNHGTRILLGVTLFGLGSAAFIWFLGSLTSRLNTGLHDGRIGSIVLAAGTAAVLAFTCVLAPAGAGALAYDNRDRTLSPASAETLDILGDGFFLVAEFIAVAFMFAAAIGILRSGVFPAWFGWLTALIGVVLIIGPVGWAALIFGIPIWTLIVSIWLFLRQSGDSAAIPAVA